MMLKEVLPRLQKRHQSRDQKEEGKSLANKESGVSGQRRQPRPRGREGTDHTERWTSSLVPTPLLSVETNERAWLH